jgi:two-component system nitrate/nitrite response regulator NarL
MKRFDPLQKPDVCMPIYLSSPFVTEERMAQQAIPLHPELGKIRVLAADNTRMNSQLLADALARDNQLRVTGIEPKATSILAAVTEERPNVVVVSLALDESATRGFELTRQICAASPETRVILLMDTTKRPAVVEAFRSGVRGVFSRTESPKTLAKCICSVHKGQIWANSAELHYVIEALCESAPMRLVDASGDAILSKREEDVVRCVAEGLSNREIAQRLTLTEHTVKNYLFRIFDKLGASSRVEVVLYAFSVRKDLVGPVAGSLRANLTGPTLVNQTVKPKGSMRLGVQYAIPPNKDMARRVRTL